MCLTGGKRSDMNHRQSRGLNWAPRFPATEAGRRQSFHFSLTRLRQTRAISILSEKTHGACFTRVLKQASWHFPHGVPVYGMGEEWLTFSSQAGKAVQTEGEAKGLPQPQARQTSPQGSRGTQGNLVLGQ